MLDEKSGVDKHWCHMAAMFSVSVGESHGKLSSLNWLSKLHRRLYKSRFVFNSRSCTTLLSILLTVCLTEVINITKLFIRGVVKFCYGLSNFRCDA